MNSVLSTYVTKFRDLARSLGGWDACLFGLTRMLGAVFGQRVRVVKYYFMSQPVRADGAPGGAGSFALHWVQDGWPLFAEVERPATVLTGRFAQGARCLAAVSRDGHLAGFLWFVVGPYEEDEVRARFVPLPDGASAWDFDVSIMPRYRMGRLFVYLWARASAELASRGVSHSLSRISAFNGPSLASHARLGARRVGSASFLCLGPLQISRWRALRGAGWHVGWRADQRPIIRVHAL